MNRNKYLGVALVLLVVSVVFCVIALSTPMDSALQIILLIFCLLLFIVGLAMFITFIMKDETDNDDSKTNKEKTTKEIVVDGNKFKAIGFNPFILYISEDESLFALNPYEAIYSVKDISSYNVMRPYSISITSVYGQFVSIYLYSNSKLTKLDVGYKEQTYSRNCNKYLKGEEGLKLIISTLNRITEPLRKEELAKYSFLETKTIWQDGQYISIDMVNKLVAISSNYSFNNVYRFSDYISCKINKKTKKVTDLNVGNAIVGGIIGGRVGSSVWGKTDSMMCLQISVIINFYNPGLNMTDEQEIFIIDNAYIDTNSSQYNSFMSVAEDIKLMCDYISKNKR